MKLEEIYKMAKQGMADGHKDADVFFDSEAVCFDTHLVKITSANIVEAGEVDDSEYLIFNFSMPDEKFHFNKD